MARKKVDSSESEYTQVAFNYSDTFFLNVKYDKQKLVELVTAYLIASTLQTRPKIKQGSKITKINTNHITCEGKIVASEGNEKPDIGIFNWLENLRKAGKHKAAIKKCEETAKEAESFIETILPKILDPILSCIVPASSNYVRGKKFEAINDLSSRIASGILSNITVYKNVLNPKIVDKANVLDKSEETPDPEGILKAGGGDGFGGNFAFAYNYIPALVSINSYITNSVNRILWGLQGEINSRNLDEVSKTRKKEQIYESCQEMAEVQTQKAEEYFLSHMEDRIRSALAEHVDESIAMSKLALDGVNFGNEILISRNTNKKKTISRLIKWREGNIKHRLNAPLHGGNRRKRGYLLTMEEKLAFVRKVDLLKIPIRNKKNIWQYIIDVMEFEQYDSECLASLRAKESLSQVPIQLLREAIDERRKYHEQKKKMPTELSPAAFILKHACLELGVNNPPGYEALKTLYRTFKKLNQQTQS
jgi:hypothetical protein